MALPLTATLDDVKVRIRTAINNPNVGKIEQVALKEGPKAYRLATLMEIQNPQSGELHHHCLKIDSIDRKTREGWFYKAKKSVTLDGDDPNEIERLFLFLKAHLEGKLSTEGDLHVIRSGDYEKLARLVDLVPSLGSPDLVDLVKVLVPRIRDSKEYLDEFVEAFESSDPQTVEYFAVAAQAVRHRRALSELERLVSTGTDPEQSYQQLLQANPWMFGSEYSELVERRTWTRDDNVDFMLRRTCDNYLEVIEIKTPFREPLFIHDKSHDSYYSSSKLSPVLGQVMRYISELERDRDAIRSRDGCDTLKVRARVIIGRDGDDGQQEALRNLNGHLHRIEVLTFDQLLRIGRRVLGVFDASVGTEHNEGGEKEVPAF